MLGRAKEGEKRGRRERDWARLERERKGEKGGVGWEIFLTFTFFKGCYKTYPLKRISSSRFGKIGK
jgi:hypothetical protein